MGQALCSPLVAVLVTMQLDTGILIANYQQAGPRVQGMRCCCRNPPESA